jgi:hypothetical protein
MNVHLILLIIIVIIIILIWRAKSNKCQANLSRILGDVAAAEQSTNFYKTQEKICRGQVENPASWITQDPDIMTEGDKLNKAREDFDKCDASLKLKQKELADRTSERTMAKASYEQCLEAKNNIKTQAIASNRKTAQDFKGYLNSCNRDLQIVNGKLRNQ